MKLILTLLLLTVGSAGAGASTLKGKSQTHKLYAAVLTLKDGNPVQGRVRFGAGKKAEFKAHDGTTVNIRVRSICATGGDNKLDDCWPKLAVEMDDLSSRTGTLEIVPPPKKK